MPVRYDERTALIVADVQNDFADPAGGLAVAGGDSIVPAVNREVERAAASGATVVYTQDWHPPTTPHFAKDGGVWPVHCVAGTWGARLHPALRILPSAEVVLKGTGGEDGYSAFSQRTPVGGPEPAGGGPERAVPGAASTGLAELLEDRGVERVVVVGLATDYCVKETALDALRLGLAATVVTDAVAAVELRPGDGDEALDELRRVGCQVVGEA